MWRSPFSTFPWLDLLGVSAIVEPNTTIVTNIGEYNFPTPRVHLSPNLRLPLKQFSLHPHVWIYVPSRRDLESFSLPCPLPCYVRPFVSFRGKAGNIGFADLTARYLSPLLAQGRVYTARTGALDLIKKRADTFFIVTILRLSTICRFQCFCTFSIFFYILLHRFRNNYTTRLSANPAAQV